METEETTAEWPQYELLGEYLEPQFGNIYEYNVEDPAYDVQEWTDELREAITHYLTSAIPQEVATVLFGLDAEMLENPPQRRTAIGALIQQNEPHEIAYEVYQAAVKAVPSLDQLIGHLDRWQNQHERDDADLWLETHLTADEVRDLARELGAKGRPHSFTLVHDYEPPALLRAWHQVTGLAPSDLTDDEWQLLTQTLPSDTPRMKTEKGLVSTRREFNGMLYRHSNQTAWTQVPRRYGNHASIETRVSSYKKKRVFARTLTALDGQPGAERLVEWLRQVETRPRARGRA
ncbi:transposase [Streptomyces ipomoeae]|uniref:transposase n=1 Tax=Streptomyces ipomoeae TaxID=103232 RepID=UPI0009977FED|nr:transposase [Streptomyces ipomoeae]MDX2697473.1 transposase [Streptomyces ipomoeae]MDX2843200.1 transposase [Streptomyces ipomoeae]